MILILIGDNLETVTPVPGPDTDPDTEVIEVTHPMQAAVALLELLDPQEMEHFRLFEFPRLLKREGRPEPEYLVAPAT